MAATWLQTVMSPYVNDVSVSVCLLCVRVKEYESVHEKRA